MSSSVGDNAVNFYAQFARTLTPLVLAAIVACSSTPSPKTGGDGADSGKGTADATACVNVVVSAADLTCTTTTDCVLVQTGEVCITPCCPGNAVVNAAAAARFASETASLPAVGAGGCGPCEGSRFFGCQQGECVFCSAGTNDCSDAGTPANDASGDTLDDGGSTHEGG
jgi:hypothetical protein